MTADTIVAVYGAVVATAVAVGQGFSWWQRRVRVRVEVSIERRALSRDESDTCRGTPVTVVRSGSDFLEEVLIAIRIANVGGAPVQISAIALEHVADDKLSLFQIFPEPLPVLLEPGTQVTCSIQKEFLDVASGVVFFGAIDGIGRRYSAVAEANIDVIGASWGLPSRVGWYQSRVEGYEAEKVQAFPVRDRAVMTSRPLTGKREVRPFIVKAG